MKPEEIAALPITLEIAALYSEPERGTGEVKAGEAFKPNTVVWADAIKADQYSVGWSGDGSLVLTFGKPDGGAVAVSLDEASAREFAGFLQDHFDGKYDDLKQSMATLYERAQGAVRD